MKRNLRGVYLTGIILLMAFFSFSQSKTAKRTYTNEAIENKIEGRVYVIFMIDKKGKILRDSIKISKGLGYGLDEIAIDAVKHAPDWDAPSKQQIEANGGFITYTVPVRFSFDQIPQNEWFEYYNWKGNNLLKEKKYDEAVLSFNEGLKISSHNPVAFYGLYEAYKSKGDTTNAKINFDKSVKKGYKPPQGGISQK